MLRACRVGMAVSATTAAGNRRIWTGYIVATGYLQRGGILRPRWGRSDLSLAASPSRTLGALAEGSALAAFRARGAAVLPERGKPDSQYPDPRASARARPRARDLGPGGELPRGHVATRPPSPNPALHRTAKARTPVVEPRRRRSPQRPPAAMLACAISWAEPPRGGGKQSRDIVSAGDYQGVEETAKHRRYLERWPRACRPPPGTDHRQGLP